MFKGLSLKQAKATFLEGGSPTFQEQTFASWKFLQV